MSSRRVFERKHATAVGQVVLTETDHVEYAIRTESTQERIATKRDLLFGIHAQKRRPYLGGSFRGILSLSRVSQVIRRRQQPRAELSLRWLGDPAAPEI